MRTASDERTSAITSSAAASPSSRIGVLAATTRSLGSGTRRTRPRTGDCTRTIDAALPLDGTSAARAASTSALAARDRDRAASSSSARERESATACSRSSGEMAPAASSASRRRSVFRDCSRAIFTWSTLEAASRWRASADCKRAVATRWADESSGRGAIHATVCPFET